MNVVEAIFDEQLFRPFLDDARGDISSWAAWFTALKVLYGLALSPGDAQLVRDCTGREKLPPGGFQTGLFLTGRRSGKSRIAAVVGAYEAALSGKEKALSPGERGLVVCIAPTTKQARIVKGYLRGLFDTTPLLRQEIAAETQDGFDLANGVSIEILAGDWRSIRGYSLLACIIDEACFFGLDTESKVRSDSELIRAVLPSLVTTGGKLICISSPYAERGWAYRQFTTCWGNNSGRTLVWRAPSRTMNETLPQSIVDEAMAEDPASARSEYLAEWRADVQTYLPRDIIEACVAGGRAELQPRPDDVRYSAFVDMSGGRQDSAALCIGHRQNRTIVIDFLKEYRPPFNPHAVCGLMADELKRYGLRSAVGDRYAGEYTTQAFRSCGVAYRSAEKNKSELYLNFVGVVCSKEIELPDNERLISQLSSLERRTRSGGRDIIDHAPGGHDDLANVCAGAAAIVNSPRVIVGGWNLNRRSEEIFEGISL